MSVSLSGIAPAYLAADCQLVCDEGRSPAAFSWSKISCILPHQGRASSDGPIWRHCFAAAGPKLWNSLPADLRQAGNNFKPFKRLLKTFVRVLRSWRIVIKAAPHKFLTYILYLVNIEEICQSDANIESSSDEDLDWWTGIKPLNNFFKLFQTLLFWTLQITAMTNRVCVLCRDHELSTWLL